MSGNTTKLLIEVTEEDLTNIGIPFTLVAELSGVSEPEVKALYQERSQKIRELGDINSKIAKLWDNRK